jgi:FixJ family two-component response regulator
LKKDSQGKRAEGEPRKLQERFKTLTPREYEVLGLVVRGMLSKQKAFELGTAERTVRVRRTLDF